jgi:A/G-specific adenine glycosylase
VERRKISRIAQALGEWYAGNARDLPWRRTSDPYAIWISEIMLQQTQVKTVIPYFERWMGALPTIRAFAAARSDAVLKLWEGLGYYSRVRNAQSAARLIMTQYGGQFPTGFDDVLALPGVGRYTAGAICSIAFNQATPIIDGNVIRVLTRVFGIGGEPRGKEVNAKLWELATWLVSTRGVEPAKLNQSLMELGALICVARQPRCVECPVQRHCFAKRTGRVDLFPAMAQKVPATERRFIALVVREGDRYLVRRREAGAVNGGLWEFPNFEIPVKTKHPASLAGPFEVTEGRPFFSVRHSITRYRILLEAFHATLPPEGTAWGARGANNESSQTGTKETKSEERSKKNTRVFDITMHGARKSITQMRGLAFTSAHRKILDAVGMIASRGSTDSCPAGT